MRFVAVLLLACILAPLPAHAVGKIGLTQLEKDKRYDPCLKADNIERCRTRLQHYAAPDLEKPEVIDREEFRKYHIRLRRFEMNEREHRNTRLLDERPTLRSSPNTEDINTSRLDYVQPARERLLECMLQPPGRLRSNCLVEVRQRLRNASRARQTAPQGGTEEAE
jgi:hypothetical protein